MSLCGFDCRHTHLKSDDYLKSSLRHGIGKIIGQAGLSSQNRNLFLTTLAELLDKEYRSKITPSAKKNLLNTLRILYGSRNRDDLWKQELKNLYGFAKNAWEKNENDCRQRDRQMANNLLWLMSSKFKNQKIIVWAHNYHIMKDYSEVSTKNDNNNVGNLMGEILSRRLSKKIYSIGFSSYSGKYMPDACFGNYKKRQAVKRPSSKSLESAIAVHNNLFALLPLREALSERKFIASALFHNHPQRVRWSRIYDAIFFIKKMKGLSRCK